MGLKKEIVVARYREPIDWLLQTTTPISLYNHGERLDIEHPLIEVVDLPNLGRESGCFLTHIVRNYNHLADLTYFIQAAPHQPYEELWQRVALKYEDTTPLTSMYLEHFPDDDVKALDKVQHIDGFEVHWGNASRFGNRTADRNRQWLAAVWSQFFTSPQPEPWYYGYGASFAVPRKSITDRPLSYWRWVHDLIVNDSNKVEMTTTSAWSFEAIAWYIWSDASTYMGKTVLPAVKKVVEPIPSKGCRTCGDRARLKKTLMR